LARGLADPPYQEAMLSATLSTKGAHDLLQVLMNLLGVLLQGFLV